MNSTVVSRRKFLYFGAAASAVVLGLGQFEFAQAAQPKLLYAGNPRDQKSPLIGDTGFISDYQYGDKLAPYKGRIIGGPYGRQFDQAQEGILDDATYLAVVNGRGEAIVGATDFKMCNEDHFGFFKQEVTLSSEGFAFSFYWPGLTQAKDGSYNGFGFEIVVLQNEGQRAIVTYLELILLGRGNLT